MPFITIAGTTYQALLDEPDEQQPEDIGGRRRRFNGNLAIGVRAQARMWQVPLAPLTLAAYDALLAATALGAKVVCNGDFNNNVAVTCTVDVAASGYLKRDGVLYRVPTVVLTQATL